MGCQVLENLIIHDSPHSSPFKGEKGIGKRLGVGARRSLF